MSSVLSRLKKSPIEMTDSQLVRELVRVHNCQFDNIVQCSRETLLHEVSNKRRSAVLNNTPLQDCGGCYK
jgi:hypothetical protein